MAALSWCAEMAAGRPRDFNPNTIVPIWVGDCLSRVEITGDVRVLATRGPAHVPALRPRLDRAHVSRHQAERCQHLRSVRRRSWPDLNAAPKPDCSRILRRMDLVVTTNVDATGRCVLDVVGAVDLASKSALVDAGHAVLRDRTGALTLDLSGVTFIDSTGIGAIVELSQDSADVGRSFLIRNPSPRVARILEVTGLASEWTIEID
jgi:anti-sigma B factor antagonist